MVVSVSLMSSGVSKFSHKCRPQYTLFELSPQELGHCLELTKRGIVAAAWLAATARQELSRFKDFIAWLRFGKNPFMVRKTTV
jgi:hypothetical protein